MTEVEETGMDNSGVQVSERLSGLTSPSKSFLHERLTSLDVFRGVTIAIMIVGNNQGGAVYYAALRHADWNGWTLADLVFPFFLFIVGAAIPFSFGNRLARGESKQKMFLKVARRSAVLFALGLFVNGFPFYDLTVIRVMGVLQRIALCYFFASLVFLFFKSKSRILLPAVLSIFYWLLMVLVPVPGYGPGVLTPDANLAAYLDNLLLHGHLYAGTWDPEGLLSTIPAVATTLIGVLAGEELRSVRSGLAKTVNLFLFGSLCVAVGIFWDLWFPINKNLWSSSFVFFTGGISLVFLAWCYYLIEVKSFKAWTKPFLVLGVNGIFLFVSSEIFALSLVQIFLPVAGESSVALKLLIYENYFASWAGQLNGSLLYSLVVLALWLGVATVLYKKRVFIKI